MKTQEYPIHWTDRLYNSFASVAVSYLAFQSVYKTAELAIFFFKNPSFFSIPISATFMCITLTLGRHFTFLAVAMAQYSWHLWNNVKSDELPPWNIKNLTNQVYPI